MFRLQTIPARNHRAFTLLEIMVVVLIVAILVSIAVPNFVQVRAKSRRTICIQNLRQIDEAKDQLAMAKSLAKGSSVDWPDIVPTYLKLAPTCPTGGIYTIGAIETDPSCSLSWLGHQHD